MALIIIVNIYFIIIFIEYQNIIQVIFLFRNIISKIADDSIFVFVINKKIRLSCKPISYSWKIEKITFREGPFSNFNEKGHELCQRDIFWGTRFLIG